MTRFKVLFYFLCMKRSNDPEWKKMTLPIVSERRMDYSLGAPLNPTVHHTAVRFKGFQWAFNQLPMIPRDASLSDDYTSDHRTMYSVQSTLFNLKRVSHIKSFTKLKNSAQLANPFDMGSHIFSYLP